MTEQVAVVDYYTTLESAYLWGYGRFEGAAREVPDDEEWHFSPFTDSAEWANSILPDLRAKAGYQDVENDEQTRTGTYNIENRVVLLEDPEDEPAFGELIDGHYLYEELIEEFQAGAHDGAHEHEQFASSSLPV